MHQRLFAEYGAVFVTTATPPPVVIFSDEQAVSEYQSALATASGFFGDYEMILQRDAMAALKEAAARASRAGLSLTARAEDSGARVYADTVRLWVRNVTRGLEHWKSLGRIDEESAARISALALPDQVGAVLELEQGGELFFGTYFDKSILYSVAAPGASQHLSLLAFDLKEYEDDRVEIVLNDCGWFRTVTGDLPHFTYLGRAADELGSMCLMQVRREYGGREYGFWLPDVAALL
ncbi:MAG TPA: hypothetical protein VKM94_25875 [Blastocatellia bacterium]|nr:hypothetical protein [Blastocatellia bacterium]